MDVEKMENKAKARAIKHIINMFQIPDQLEKLDQYRRCVLRKKTSVKTMLETAMQSQLNDTSVGLTLFQTALDATREVKDNLNWIKDAIQLVPQLSVRLNAVHEEHTNHSQYVTAITNFKHVFTVPESIEKTRIWISEGKLLHAHQSLTDLENSRDQLLYEIHKLPFQPVSDVAMLNNYFKDVEVLSELLLKQLLLIVKRTLNIVRKEPVVIVTALRIIEREEKADTFILQKSRQSGFFPPGRPKNWREKALNALEEVVAERIEGNQFEEKKDNNMWLKRHLEFTRQIIFEDLRIVKTLCVPCFPPGYDIVNTFVGMYHECLSTHIQELISSGLQSSECVSILSWIMNTYNGTELMKSPQLNINIVDFGPLLDNTIIESVQNQYLNNMNKKYEEWMKNVLANETNDWYKKVPPEIDIQGCYYTTTPLIIFQMIEQNLQVSHTVSQELMYKAFLVSMEQVTVYGRLYQDAIVAFKMRHFEDRRVIPYFTHYMISIINNCLRFVELTHSTKQRYWQSDILDNDADQTFKTSLDTYLQLRDEAAGFLLDEVFLDLEPHFQDLLTTKWMTSAEPVDTICATLEDYFQDYVHLSVRNFDYVISTALDRTANKYVTAMLQNKPSFKNYEQRKETALKIIGESKQISEFFVRLSPALATFDSPFNIISALIEVLKIQDTDSLTIELHGLVEKYPDITQDQLTSLLCLRGDIGILVVRQKVADILSQKQTEQRASIPKSIFSQISI